MSVRLIIEPHEVIRLGFMRWQVVLRATTSVVVPIRTFWFKRRAAYWAKKMNEAFAAGYNWE